MSILDKDFVDKVNDQFLLKNFINNSPMNPGSVRYWNEVHMNNIKYVLEKFGYNDIDKFWKQYIDYRLTPDMMNFFNNPWAGYGSILLENFILERLKMLLGQPDNVDASQYYSSPDMFEGYFPNDIKCPNEYQILYQFSKYEYIVITVYQNNIIFTYWKYQKCDPGLMHRRLGYDVSRWCWYSKSGTLILCRNSEFE